VSAANLDQLTDEELACRARAGSMGCFEELVRRYQVPLLRFLQLRSPRPREAEDILQDAFLRAFQSLAKYQEQYPFKTWLFTIAYRLAVSSARKASNAKECLRTDRRASDQPGPDQSIMRRESRNRLWAIARENLTDEQYAALWLHYVEDTSPREIAAVMGRSWVWVRTALHRARRKLSMVLEEPQTAGMGVVATGDV
jgi:RNA polymerase sigma-70 factor (ECF subfamily)